MPLTSHFPNDRAYAICPEAPNNRVEDVSATSGGVGDLLFPHGSVGYNVIGP